MGIRINRVKDKNVLWDRILNVLDAKHYHLHRTLNHWSLYRKYEDISLYLGDSNVAILEGANTVEDLQKLYTYLKSHRTLDAVSILLVEMMGIVFFNFGLTLINMISVHSTVLSKIILGTNLVIILLLLTLERVKTHNLRVDSLRLQELLAEELNTANKVVKELNTTDKEKE